jgi:hypothetical protein
MVSWFSVDDVTYSLPYYHLSDICITLCYLKLALFCLGLMLTESLGSSHITLSLWTDMAVLTLLRINACDKPDSFNKLQKEFESQVRPTRSSRCLSRNSLLYIEWRNNIPEWSPCLKD